MLQLTKVCVAPLPGAHFELACRPPLHPLCPLATRLCCDLRAYHPLSSPSWTDGNGTIDFNEFVDVQKQVADAKEAESQTWFTEPNKIQIRKNGCLRADKKHFEFLMYKSSEGSERCPIRLA